MSERTRIGYYDEEGDPVLVPACWEICKRCGGEGGHGNPAFDGLSADDEFWTDDEDFTRSYVRGEFDVTCAECAGSGKRLEVDIINCTPEQLDGYYQWLNDEAEARQVEAMERRAGA